MPLLGRMALGRPLRIAAGALLLWASSHALATPAPPRTDFNGDGKADLVWRNSADGAPALWLMNGVAPTATSTILTDPELGQVEHVGDFNGDGKTDLVWRNSGDRPDRDLAHERPRRHGLRHRS